MAEPNPGRPGGTGGSTPGVGPRSATAATFQVNDASLQALHKTWQLLIKDVKDFNAELKKVDGSKLGAMGGGGGLGGGGGRMPGMPPIPRPDVRAVGSGRTGAGADSIPGLGNNPPNPGENPPLAGGASPWKKVGAAVGGTVAATGMFYQRRMDDISDADLYFNQQAQNTGWGYRHDEKGQARNALFGRPGGAGYGGGIRGYQSVQDLLGGARSVFAATGGTTGGRGMAQLRAAGQLTALTPDMGLAASGAAVGGLYDPTMSARLMSIGAGPSVGMGGQLQSPQAIYNNVLQRVYRGQRPTARMITEGMQPGAPLYMTLTQGLGLTPDQIEQFSRYAIAQANLGGNVRDTNRAIDYASRGQSGAHLNKEQKALVNRAGLNDNIRSRQNELGGAQARQTIEAGREAEGALISGFSKLAELTDALVNSFKRLNDVTGGGSGYALGGAGLLGGTISSGLNAVGGIGGSMFAYQSLRQMMGRGGAPPGVGGGGLLGRGAGLLGRGAAGFAGIGGGALAAGLGAGLVGYGAGELADWGMRKAGVKNKWGQAAGGAAAGALTGAAIGSVVPVLGTGIGAAVGGVAGGLAGYFAQGGVIPGDHHNDTVDIRATPGEVVVPRGVVTRHGGPEALMRALGFGGVGQHGKYAGGGEVTGDTKGLNSEFLRRLTAWSKAVGQPFHIGSGYRSIAEQKVLYDRWMRRVPGQAKAAKPGSSNHNYGLAVDGPHWRDKHPEKFGLRYPMSFEPWHVEPVNAKAMRGGAHIAAPGIETSDTTDAQPDGTEPKASTGAGNMSASNPGVFTDEKTLMAAFLANSNSPYGIQQQPTPTTDTPASSSGTDSTPGQANAPGAPSNPTGNVALGKQKAAARGWTGKEWDSLYQLFQKESGWRTEAANNSSSARGIAQTMMSVHFGKGWKNDKRAIEFMHNAGQQIDWGLNYISGRYGVPSKAWEHSQKMNWYEQGAWRTGDETARLHQDEMVVPKRIADPLRTMVRDHQNGMPSTSSDSRSVSVTIHMPVTLAGTATQQDAKHLVSMLKSELQEDKELARLGSGS